MSKHFEHDGCNGCEYEHTEFGIYPCKGCKMSVTQMDSRYDDKPDLWSPAETSTKEHSMVDHPSHYSGSCSLECLDVMQITFGDSATAWFCLLNAFKYMWRYSGKNGLEDLKKAEWYLDTLVEIGTSPAQDTMRLRLMDRLESLLGKFE